MRVAILGNSGSGKSTLAKKLSGDSSVPSLDLDTIYWEPGKVAIERKTSDREADLRRFCSDHDHWIIEGCYADLIEASFPWRPELVFLHPGCEVCVQNCRDRPHEAHKYRAKKEQDRRLSFLLQWVSQSSCSSTQKVTSASGRSAPRQYISVDIDSQCVNY